MPTSRGLSVGRGCRSSRPARRSGAARRRSGARACRATRGAPPARCAHRDAVDPSAGPPAGRGAARPTRRPCAGRRSRPASRRRPPPSSSPSTVWLLPMSAASMVCLHRSRPRSKTITEWVSAPTEMKSTPVSARRAARSRVSPPDASSWRGRRRSHRLGHQLGRHVVEQDPVAAGASSSRSWSRSVTSTSTGRSGKGARTAS